MRKIIFIIAIALFIVFIISVPTLAVKPEDTNIKEIKNSHENGSPPDPGGKDTSTGRPESPGNSDESNGKKSREPVDPGSADTTGQGNEKSVGRPESPGNSGGSNGNAGKQPGSPDPSDTNGQQKGKDTTPDASPSPHKNLDPAGNLLNPVNETGIQDMATLSGTAQDVQGPLASALHLLPPLGVSIEDKKSFDRTLVDFLNVAICEIQDDNCIPVTSFTSQTSNGGLDFIKIQNHHYHVNWNTGLGERDTPYRIQFSVAGLEIGYIDYTTGSNRTVPIKFQIDNIPRIRVRVMHEQGASAQEIALVLKNEFHLDKDETADLLAEENFSRLETGEAIIVVYELDAPEGAVFLKNRGYLAQETYDVLMLVFDIQDEFEIENILANAGYQSSEFLDFTARRSISRFAPVLKFDGSYSGLPMSAQDYFQSMLTLATDTPAAGQITWTVPWDGPSPCNVEGRVKVCARDECNCGMQNNDFSKLANGQVPTYYQTISDIETTKEGRLRIAYWWFYGFQTSCSYVDGCPGMDGSHHGDWEKIIVTTSPDRTRADYVTYEFHGDWYTRKWGGFETVGDRPVAYVGKIGHGNYHSNEISGWMAGTPSYCCEYADYRNPHSNTIWYNTTDNLVSLKGDSEPWLTADNIGSTYDYNGVGYTISSWRWGPHISYCDWWLFGCMDWEHNQPISTHPTTYNLAWTMQSCSAEGCGASSCKGLVYTHDADYNQGWPWDA